MNIYITINKPLKKSPCWYLDYMFMYIKILLWIFHVFYKHRASYYLSMNGYDIRNIYIIDCIFGCVSDQLLIERVYKFCC